MKLDLSKTQDVLKITYAEICLRGPLLLVGEKQQGVFAELGKKLLSERKKS